MIAKVQLTTQQAEALLSGKPLKIRIRPGTEFLELNVDAAVVIVNQANDLLRRINRVTQK